MPSAEFKTIAGTTPVSGPRRDRLLGGLLVRRERWTLSRPAQLLIVAMLLGSVLALKYFLYPFLAVTERVPAEVLVIEGWSPPYAMKEAAAEFWAAGYKRILVTRAIYDPQDEDVLNPRSVDYMVRVLARDGAPRDRINTVFSAAVRKDRTFSSALSVKRWLKQQGMAVKALDVATMSTHARRSRLLYQKAFGDEVKVGIVSMQDTQFDPDRWWASSEGVREVLSEAIAYGYARLLFHATPSDLSQ